MSRELDLIAKEFSKTPVTVIRKDVNLYGTTIQNATHGLLKMVEQECKKHKQSSVTFVAVIHN